MTPTLEQQKQRYAELIVRTGINLQVGQCLRIGAELAHAEFVRDVVAHAYDAGAKFVHVEWLDEPTARARMLRSRPDHLDFVPDWEVTYRREMVDDRWPRVSIVGAEFPDCLDDVDPAIIRRYRQARAKKLKFYTEATMSNHMQWCVAAVPTRRWAQKVFPNLNESDAVERLWGMILMTARADQPDPVAAWEEHDLQLSRIAREMMNRDVRTVRFFDPTPASDGKPSTDLTIGLTDAPRWVGGSSFSSDDVRFFANIPTEEIFTSPHRLRADGWVRTSKPFFPMEREVDGAYFRFEHGEVVEFRAEKGQDVLAGFFELRGARRLGEVALVDVRSPINQTDILFHDTLFDENAVCHIAFGTAYTEGMIGGNDMTADEREAAGLNDADTHEDFMIGTPTMHVFGVTSNGDEVQVMRDGKFHIGREP